MIIIYKTEAELAKEEVTLPIYEYQCTECGKIFEIFQSFKDEPLKKCSHCSGKVTKLISNCSFQLKGTGWYLTDYARKDGTSSPNSMKGSEKKPEESKSAESKAAESKSSDTAAPAKEAPAKQEPAKPKKADD
jgi:putative FmdB family regulatory protein